MKPVLEVLADFDVLSMRHLTERISQGMHLTDDERRETISSSLRRALISADETSGFEILSVA